jgi:hypothetical protein
MCCVLSAVQKFLQSFSVVGFNLRVCAKFWEFVNFYREGYRKFHGRISRQKSNENFMVDFVRFSHGRNFFHGSQRLP